MADQPQLPEGPENRRRPQNDRDVAQHVHQKVSMVPNTNRDGRKQLGLDELIQKLRKSGKVNEKELTVRRFFQQLPLWAPDQPQEVQAYYRGMQTLMKSLHLSRCRYLNHLVDGRGGSLECNQLKDDIKTSGDELVRLQQKIEELGGRVWVIPQPFDLPLALQKKA